MRIYNLELGTKHKLHWGFELDFPFDVKDKLTCKEIVCDRGVHQCRAWQQPPPAAGGIKCPTTNEPRKKWGFLNCCVC